MTVASTDDEAVTVCVEGGAIRVQLEPEVMRRSGYEVAQRVMACADAAYLEEQVKLRGAWEIAGLPTEGMPGPAALEAAQARLEAL